MEKMKAIGVSSGEKAKDRHKQEKHMIKVREPDVFENSFGYL